jgi:hypothetical protein
MTAEYVRSCYRVPAKRGGRVIADGNAGVITGFQDQYLLVRLDGDEDSSVWHPTWHMEYVTVNWSEAEPWSGSRS